MIKTEFFSSHFRSAKRNSSAEHINDEVSLVFVLFSRFSRLFSLDELSSPLVLAAAIVC